jgi:hypothetical protein
MIPFGVTKAPSSYGRIKSEIFHLGVACYLRSARTRKVFNAVSRGIGEIALAFNPNYRRGEIREAIHRQLELEEFEPKAIASDLRFNQPLEQSGIEEHMRHSLAWEFITRNIADGYRGQLTLFLGKNMFAGLAAGIAYFQFGILNRTKKFAYVFLPLTIGILFLTGAGILAGRSICDWIRSNKHRDAGFRYFTSNPFSEMSLMINYQRYKEDWSEKEQVRFINHLVRFDPDLAARLDREKIGN